MRIICEHCGFVMYRKPVVYHFLEFCDSFCLEEYKDVKTLLEKSNEALTRVSPQKGYPTTAPVGQNALAIGKGGM